MINPKCDICKMKLKDYGALLFSPPKDSKVSKFHICKECYYRLIKTNHIEDEVEMTGILDKTFNTIDSHIRYGCFPPWTETELFESLKFLKNKIIKNHKTLFSKSNNLPKEENPMAKTKDMGGKG